MDAGSQGMDRLIEWLHAIATTPWALLLGLVFTGPFCGPEQAERVVIPGSAWTIVTQVYRCSVVDPGRLEIIAQDTRSNEKRPILTLSTEEDTHVEYHPEGYLTITLPNLVEITSQADRLDRYSIEYNYVPKDDPGERSQYVYWLHHPNDPDADAWCREHLRIQRGAPDREHCF